MSIRSNETIDPLQVGQAPVRSAVERRRRGEEPWRCLVLVEEERWGKASSNYSY